MQAKDLVSWINTVGCTMIRAEMKQGVAQIIEIVDEHLFG
jgi:hypothetical protein